MCILSPCKNYCAEKIENAINALFPSASNSHTLIVGGVILLATSQMIFAQIPGSISASEILRSFKEGQKIRQDTLDGQLRNEGDGKTFPFRMYYDGSLIRYRFEGTPPTVVQMHSVEGSSQFEVFVGD